MEKKADDLFHISDGYMKDHDSTCKLFLDVLNDHDYNEVFVIGGQRVYEQTIGSSFLDKVYLTRINREIEGDTYFPRLYENFDLISSKT